MPNLILAKHLRRRFFFLLQKHLMLIRILHKVFFTKNMIDLDENIQNC